MDKNNSKEEKTQKIEIENDALNDSSKKGCLYAILIFLAVVGIMVAIKFFFV